MVVLSSPTEIGTATSASTLTYHVSEQRKVKLTERFMQCYRGRNEDVYALQSRHGIA